MKMYARFTAMIATSTLVMFALTYLTAYRWEHVYFSEVRAYMAALMGATMAVVMLAFMLNMLKDRRANAAVVAAALLTFGGMLWLVRSQETIEDVAWMEAMIPHHSIAILTSSRAEISDPRVRALADRIIESQLEEITEMKALIEEIEAER